MSEDNTFIVQPIFLQVTKLLHRSDIRSIAENEKPDDTDEGVEFNWGVNKVSRHRARRIA